jgi:hypothetical protein
LEKEIAKHDIFYDKNMDVFIKPVKLIETEDPILTSRKTNSDKKYDPGK